MSGCVLIKLVRDLEDEAGCVGKASSSSLVTVARNDWASNS